MMLCTSKVKRECPYSYLCGGKKRVSDNSECADFIREVMKRQATADAVEAEYLRQERQAIQEEVTP